jgi:hypothetical protein
MSSTFSGASSRHDARRHIEVPSMLVASRKGLIVARQLPGPPMAGWTAAALHDPMECRGGAAARSLA